MTCARLPLLLLLLSAVPATLAHAADPGDIPNRTPRLTPVARPEQRGPLWPIVEEDMRATILTRYHDKLPEIKQGVANSIQAYRVPAIDRPTTDTPRTLTLDPSFTLDADLITPDGQLLARAGDRLNPLATLPFLRTYLLINAADPRQLAWAAAAVHATVLRPTTVLLTDGNLQEAAQALPPGTPLHPAPLELFTRYPIDSVPARLSRAGARLRLEFIPESALP